MPRKPRELYPNALYHVTSRGNARQVIFHTDNDRKRFLDQMDERVATYGVIVYAFILMENHYHLLVRTPRANLSRFMQRLNTSYALYYRYKHSRPGHVFQGRYKAMIVKDETYMLALTRYIHLNPVKTKKWQEAEGAARVKHLREYRWSSYPSYASGESKLHWLSLKLLTHYGRTRRQAADRYRAYTEAMVLRDDESLLAALKSAGHALGSEEAIDKPTRPGVLKHMNLSELDRRVALYFGVTIQDLRRHGHSVGTAKRVAMELATRVDGLGLQEVGAHYGGVSASAVTMNRRRLRDKDLRDIDVLWKQINS